KKIATTLNAICIKLGQYIYGYDKDSLAGVLGMELKKSGHTLAVAESCTGGLLGHLITNEPGSSDYYLGGIVGYSNEVKIRLLGVSPNTLRAYGAVSEECVSEMLKGVKEKMGCFAAIAITGIAGPSGGSVLKPVGTVYVGVGYGNREHIAALSLSGNREIIKERAAKEGLRLLMALAKGQI
ncbi:MAG: nicotinamide-nucleotide amidohydrolase family protein, partial [bacterium]|nr:nicotinamide-nucleotide amidohydrolase family protein [bacterium]